MTKDDWGVAALLIVIFVVGAFAGGYVVYNIYGPHSPPEEWRPIAIYFDGVQAKDIDGVVAMKQSDANNASIVYFKPANDLGWIISTSPVAKSSLAELIIYVRIKGNLESFSLHNYLGAVPTKEAVALALFCQNQNAPNLLSQSSCSYWLVQIQAAS